MELYPHKSGGGLIEPVAMIGHNVCVKYANDNHYVKVIWLEPIPHFQALNIGAVAAGTVSARTQATLMQVWRNEFAQFRWFPLEAQWRLYLPNADGRFNLRNLQVPVDPTIVTRDPCGHLTECFVWEDRNPAFEATNYTAIALGQCRIVAYGYRFVTEELPQDSINAIKKGSMQCTYIAASGFAGKPS